MERQHHKRKVEDLQLQLQKFFVKKNSEEASSIDLRYQSGQSNTTRSKSYKKSTSKLDLGPLQDIIQIDLEKHIAIVEPRVTMKDLLQATIPLGLMPPVVPEFKGITIGGAIMGGAMESSSHHFGSFSDNCNAFEILCGDGTLLRASPSENQDIFYGIQGSYGSLGVLVSAELKLIPTKDFVHLRYHSFSKPGEAIDFIRHLSHAPTPPDFIDGIVFAKDHSVVMEGNLRSKAHLACHLPCFSLQSLSSPWYYEHVKKVTSKVNIFEEVMTSKEYLFRYDQGAFWMGSYLCRLPLLLRFITQVICKIGKSKNEKFSKGDIQKYHNPSGPNPFLRTILHRVVSSQNLWKLFHKAEKWAQDRLIIQDFCIPEEKSSEFLKEALESPGTLPIWLCPIKGTNHPEIFAHHLSNEPDALFINIGVYGLPSYYAPIEEITKKIERKTKIFSGRKILYSRSYYTKNEFWEIYSKDAYDLLREKMKAKGVWHEITSKVLCE
ncbi:MAG: FAD-binding oxidoreductase [Chlamydiae bacterium]|nr:FAD-binding oxidoreductase [Chlamydiota bacterium]